MEIEKPKATAPPKRLYLIKNVVLTGACLLTMRIEPRYKPSYWINRRDKIAAVRVSPSVIQWWQATGRDYGGNFFHLHAQVHAPTPAWCDDFLEGYEPSCLEEYIRLQFEHHQLDDLFREKANELRQKWCIGKWPVPAGI